MINETIVSRLESLIIDASKEMDMPSARELAEYLSENGVICTPVKIGQTVYAALPRVFYDEESIVYAWEVKGLGVDEKGKYVAFNEYGEHYTVGEESCRLAKEEAEQDLRNFEAEYTKEVAKNE
jgi:hypothetical protein